MSHSLTFDGLDEKSEPDYFDVYHVPAKSNKPMLDDVCLSWDEVVSMVNSKGTVIDCAMPQTAYGFIQPTVFDLADGSKYIVG